MEEADCLVCASEFIKDRLYFVTLRMNSNSWKPKPTANTHYFSIDDELVYENFYSDFGPLNLAMLYRYCLKLDKKLKTYHFAKKKIIHYTTMDCNKRVNAAFLIASYAIIYLKRTPEEAFRPLVTGSNVPFTLFRDASLGTSQYTLSLMDCLQAVYKAHNAGFFNLTDFDVDEYEYYERVENGDLNWILPQKFIAFCGPHDKSKIEKGYPLHSPETYFGYFRKNHITTVVRLNKKIYDATRFTNAGFQHCDLFFIDGSTPSDAIMQQFLDIAEGTNGGLAVHCKAGLGRTGSLIGCYIMKHYHWTAMETIAWTRLCRPGSIIGHQQYWLQEKQAEMWQQGDAMRKQFDIKIPHHTLGIYSRRLKALNSELDRNEGEMVVKQEVTNILQQVDTMKLVDLEDENKNAPEPSRSTINRNSDEPMRTTIITQGDKLNQIKALRRHARSVTTGAIREDTRPRTRAKSQPFRSSVHSQSPQTILSPLKPSRMVTPSSALKEKEGVAAKRVTRTPTPPSKRTTWLLSSNNGSNRSLNISKLCLNGPSPRLATRASMNVLPSPSTRRSQTPEPSATPPMPLSPVTPGMTLRSADRLSRYQSAHRHGRACLPRCYKSAFIR